MDATILDHLTRVVAEHGQHALWFEALPWIAETCDAVGARVFVGPSNVVLHQYGQISDEVALVIDRWEESVISLEGWIPRGDGSLSTRPPVSTAIVDSDHPLMHVTILQGNNVIGGLSLCFSRPEELSPGVVSTVSALTQAVNRIGQLATERHLMQRRLTQMGLLYEVSRAITSTLDVNTVLEYTTVLAANTLGASAASLILVDHATNELVFTISHGETGNRLRGLRMPWSEGIAGWVARLGQPLIVNDTSRDTRFTQRVDSLSGFVTHNVLCVPLQVRGRIVGVLEVLNKEKGGDFGEEDLDWLTTLAAQGAIAIENARLFSSLREERDRIIEAEAEVRHELARNLHDSTAQLLHAITLNIDAARRLADSDPAALDAEFVALRLMAQQASQEIRLLLFELRPLILESRGLAAALESYVAQQKKLWGYNIELQLEELPAFGNRHTEAAVFLILQEALANARKHAQAQHTWLRLRADDRFLIADVEDDGRGFDLATVEKEYADRSSLGLLTMRERASRLDGLLRIHSPRPNHPNGTMVSLRFPLNRLAES